MKLFYIYLVISLMIAGCSTAPKEFYPAENLNLSTTSTEAKKIAAQIGGREVTEIKFDEDSADLTTLSEKLLKQSFENAKARGPIERIAVVTWSDEEYPSEKGSELSREQRKLAVARNYVVKEYLKTFDKKSVIRVYSMADRPGFIDKLIENSEWRIKKSLEGDDSSDTDGPVQKPSKASHSIILFKNISNKEMAQ